MKRLLISLFVLTSLLTSLFAFMPVSAQAAGRNDPCHQSGGFLGFPTWYEYLEIGSKNGDPCAIIGPKDTQGEFSFQQALPRIVLAIVEIMLRIAGMLAVGYVIFGGFRYMTSQGEPDATKKAQGTVLNALIGLAIAVLATTIVSFIGGKL